jgi:hypothetical protein
MVTPYFSSIRKTLVNAIIHAAETIDIAVAWFTNEEIFDAVLAQLDQGVKVRLVLINDDINHCGGLDFQSFVNQGGQLFFGKTGYFMHNKYCIIDGKSVYTGSYNYTYFAEHSNFENIVCIADEVSAVSEYIKNFELILSVSDSVTNIEEYLKEHPYAVNTHATRQMTNRDLYQKANEFFERKNTVRAEEILTKIALSTENMDSYVIRDVLYQQWQPEYCIRRIVVTGSEVIVSIENTIRRRQGYASYVTVYGTGLDKTWHLETPGGVIYANSVKNIRFDGTRTLYEIGNNTVYIFAEPGNNVLIPMSEYGKALKGGHVGRADYMMPMNAKVFSCDIIFQKGDYINGTVNLFEGNNNDQGRIGYWHFLRVNMRLNREPL